LDGCETFVNCFDGNMIIGGRTEYLLTNIRGPQNILTYTAFTLNVLDQVV